MAVINGTIGKDNLKGTSSADVLFGGLGPDVIDGGAGVDRAIYTGRYQDYTIKQSSSANLNYSIEGPDGKDEIKNVEFLVFDNGVYDTRTNAFTGNSVSMSGVGSTVTEGDGHTLDYSFTRTGDLTSALTVSLTSSFGGGGSNADFGAIPTGITFAAGSSTAVAYIGVSNDLLVEGNETLTVALAPDAQHYILGAQTSATGTVISDDVLPSITMAGGGTVTEGDGHTLDYTLTRTGDLSSALNVALTSSFGDGGSSADFGVIPTSVTFAAGSSTATAHVSVIDDNLVEGNETLSLAITADPQSFTLGAQTSASGSVISEDVPAPINFDDISYYDSGQVVPAGYAGLNWENVSLKIYPGNSNNQTVTDPWGTGENITTAGADFSLKSAYLASMYGITQDIVAKGYDDGALVATQTFSAINGELTLVTFNGFDSIDRFTLDGLDVQVGDNFPDALSALVLDNLVITFDLVA